jgi:hypothetical protein
MADGAAGFQLFSFIDVVCTLSFLTQFISVLVIELYTVPLLAFLATLSRLYTLLYSSVTDTSSDQ